MKIALKKTKFIFFVLLTFILLAGAKKTGISTESWRDQFKPGHTREEIAKKFNLHGGLYWNYYARGRWYAEGGYYDEAIKDFQKSIKLRSNDYLSARSYGMHFTEYFAHRELGIAYYSLGKYEEAKGALEKSLSATESARAMFYLNKCNEAILKMTKGEQPPPEIRITSHTNGAIVNTPRVKINGVAISNGYVNYVSINGKNLFNDLAQKSLNFSEYVSLNMGENVIGLEVSDLLGKRTQIHFMLILDMQPPAIYLDEIKILRKDGRYIATIKGTVSDDYEVNSLWINNTGIPLSPGKEAAFEQDIVLTDGPKISFKIVDGAGNVTSGEEFMDIKPTLWPGDIMDSKKYANQERKTPVLLAATNVDRSTVKDLLSPSIETSVPQNTPNAAPSPYRKEEDLNPAIKQEGSADTIPPVIHVDVTSTMVYDENFFLSGHVHDDSKVVKIFVNQIPLEIRPAKHIFFKQLIKLQEGENIIIVKASDSNGNETQYPSLSITKKTFELLETEARYTVALLPLRRFTEHGIPSETLHFQLLKAFDKDSRRFNFVEKDFAKLTGIIQKQKIDDKELASPDIATQIGKVCATDGVFCGVVEEDAKGINIILQLVDTDTGQTLVNADVYDEDRSAKNLEWLLYGLSLKIKQKFPLLQGNVIRISGNGFHINTGATSGVGVGMKLLLFREIKEGSLLLKEPLDIVARVVQVQPETAFAKIVSTKSNDKIQKADFVMTK